MASKYLVYGRAAYEGFAKAIGSKMGLKVTVEDGATACIDAQGTVHLPAMNTFQSPEQFEITCGTIVHELAHQFYKSHALIDPKRSRLEHDCLNAVLDVADETGIDQWFAASGNARPGRLLELGNRSAIQDRLHDWDDQTTDLWKVLCTGILLSRIARDKYLSRIKRYNQSSARRRYNIDCAQAWKLIKRAKQNPKTDAGPNSKRFPKLVKLAKQLADLLAPLAPPESKQPGSAPQPGQPGADTSPASPGGSALETALNAGSHSVPGYATEATSRDGAGMGDPTHSTTGKILARESAYQLVYPAVGKIAQRIAIDGDGLDCDSGLFSGPILGQAYRLNTDGQCLARWQQNEHADGLAVAVLLDCSGSMERELPECAAIAKAFVKGMRECADVHPVAFGSDVEESKDDFATVYDMGGTATNLALREARDWLASRSAGSKWIICVTDGDPGDPNATAKQCVAARADGVRILTIGLGCEIDRATMPHATIVTAEDAMHLAIELEAAARLIEG